MTRPGFSLDLFVPSVMDWGGVEARDDLASRENCTGGGAGKYGIGGSADVVANLIPVRSLRHTFCFTVFTIGTWSRSKYSIN